MTQQRGNVHQFLFSDAADLAPEANFWHVPHMGRDEVIAKLKAHRDELEDLGILHASVCGSTARGEATPESDVDVLADFDKARGLTLVSLSRARRRLNELLGAEVDLLDRDTLPARVRARIEAEAVLAF